MTTIKETLKADLTVALKARDTLGTAVIRSVLGAISTAEKGGKTAVEFNDDKVMTLIASQVKQRKASAQEYIRVNVPERAEAELAEAEFLMRYLPQQLTEAELVTIVQEVIAGMGGTITLQQAGQVTGKVAALTKGKADGKLVNQIVRSFATD